MNNLRVQEQIQFAYDLIHTTRYEEAADILNRIIRLSDVDATVMSEAWLVAAIVSDAFPYLIDRDVSTCLMNAVRLNNTNFEAWIHWCALRWHVAPDGDIGYRPSLQEVQARLTWLSEQAFDEPHLQYMMQSVTYKVERERGRGADSCGS